jgi:hypothetical protein
MTEPCRYWRRALRNERHGDARGRSCACAVVLQALPHLSTSQHNWSAVRPSEFGCSTRPKSAKSSMIPWRSGNSQSGSMGKGYNPCHRSANRSVANSSNRASILARWRVAVLLPVAALTVLPFLALTIPASFGRTAVFVFIGRPSCPVAQLWTSATVGATLTKPAPCHAARAATATPSLGRMARAPQSEEFWHSPRRNLQFWFVAKISGRPIVSTMLGQC